MNNAKINLSLLALLLSIGWFIISFIFNEDPLGGASHDFKYHEKYFYYFSNNFAQTISEYGLKNEVRNSPVFYILFSKIYHMGISIDNLKYFNLFIIFPIIFFFNKCLDLKYNNPNNKIKFLLISCIFLSPTVRSLINYPYPLIWAICFFLISIYFFLKFKKVNELKRSNCLLCILNLSIASYFTPNFAVFIIFYFYHFFLNLKNSKELLLLIVFSFILSIPAIAFLIWKDFYMFKNNVFNVSIYEKINLSNKIVIITSFLIFFFIPYIKKIYFSLDEIKAKIKDTNFIILLSLIFLCSFYFDYKSGAGGGFFYKLSIILFKNDTFILSVFVFSLLFFYFANLINKNNLVIYTILILYNLQYSIYYKYFDPLLIFIFLFLMRIDKSKSFNLNMIGNKYFLLYFIFLCMNIFKKGFLKMLII